MTALLPHTSPTPAASVESPRSDARPPLPATGLWSRLGVALLVAVVVAALPTVVVPGLLLGPAVMNGSARGTALVMLVVGLPLAAAGLAGARRGSPRWTLVWLGAVAYLLYNAVMLVLATPLNALFLAYVALLGLAMWTLLVSVAAVDRTALAASLRPLPAARGVAGFVVVVAVLNVLAWLRPVVGGLLAADPQLPLAGTGLTTNGLWVQDLAVWLPLMAVAGAAMWTGRVWGRLVVTAGLVLWTVEAVTVAVDQWLGSHADPASTVATVGGSVMFAVLAVVTAPLAWLALRSVEPGGS